MRFGRFFSISYPPQISKRCLRPARSVCAMGRNPFGVARTRATSPLSHSQRIKGERRETTMELTWQSILTAGGVLSALLLLLTTYNRVYRWTLRQAGRRTEGHPQGEHAADLRRAGLPQRHGRAGLQRPGAGGHRQDRKKLEPAGPRPVNRPKNRERRGPT